MRVLILGSTGMLGHMLLRNLAKDFEVIGTVRQEIEEISDHKFFKGRSVIGGVRAEDIDSLARTFKTVKPHVVVNCIGIVKQREEANEAIPCLMVNSLFPHRLSWLCGMSQARLIHISTDCVFSGSKEAGQCYALDDACDPVDLYGRSKFLGEVDQKGCLTLRTSFIGPELRHRHGLLEWLLSQRGGRVSGYARAIFSGFTTTAVTGIIASVIKDHPDLSGIWHVASQPVNKFDLLNRLVDALGLDIAVERDDTVECNRCLDGSRFNAAADFVPPAWDQMIGELAICLQNQRYASNTG
jgi:dTDP-4-dehydrorhamnose reductase